MELSGFRTPVLLRAVLLSVSGEFDFVEALLSPTLVCAAALNEMSTAAAIAIEKRNM